MKSRQSQYEHEPQGAADSSEDEGRHEQPQERQHSTRKRGRNSGGNGNGSSGNGGNGNGSSEKGKPKLYCICRQPDDGQTPMFQCDGCQEWFHAKCIGLSELDMNKMKSKKTYCPNCAPSSDGRKRPSDGTTTATTDSSAGEKGSSSPAHNTAASGSGASADAGSESAAVVKSSENGAADTAAVATEPTKKKAKTIVWNGSMKCEGIGLFNLSAQFVCGSADMSQLVPSHLTLQKRLQLDKLLDYLHKCSISSSRKRCVLRLEASGSDADLHAYNSLHKYFLNRNKAGYVEVEGTTSHEGYEMMYLVPLQCNATSLPSFISQDPSAIVNKRIVTSGAQKPRFLLVLVGEHNSAVTSSTESAVPDSDKQPATDADATVKKEAKPTAATTTAATTSSEAMS